MRKGVAEFLEWFPRLMLMIVAVVIIVLIVRSFTDRDVKAQELHAETMLARLYYDDIIMFSDQTGRIYPGIVDKNKFESLNQSNPFESTGLTKTGARLEVEPDGACGIAEEQYIFPATFNQYYSLAAAGVQGSQSGTIVNVLWPVTVVDGNTECITTLNITIVRANS